MNKSTMLYYQSKMKYYDTINKLFNHAAEVEKWKQGMVKSHPNKEESKCYLIKISKN